jgi:hypothetical protein
MSSEDLEALRKFKRSKVNVRTVNRPCFSPVSFFNSISFSPFNKYFYIFLLLFPLSFVTIIPLPFPTKASSDLLRKPILTIPTTTALFPRLIGRQAREGKFDTPDTQN